MPENTTLVNGQARIQSGSLYKILNYLTSLSLIFSLSSTHTPHHEYLNVSLGIFIELSQALWENTLKMFLNNFTYLKLILSWKYRVLNNDFMLYKFFNNYSYGHWASFIITLDESIEITCLNFTWQWEILISLDIGKLVSQQVIIELFLPA